MSRYCDKCARTIPENEIYSRVYGLDFCTKGCTEQLQAVVKKFVSGEK